MRIAVVIGRFQPVHQGHLALIRQALACSEYLVIVLGSAAQARSSKNPWSGSEREHMIRQALPDIAPQRLLFLPVRDLYNAQRWTKQVYDGVHKLLLSHHLPHDDTNIALIGHEKDASSAYLHGFASWQTRMFPRQNATDATALRRTYFAAALTPQSTETTHALSCEQQVQQALNAMQDALHDTTRAYLADWAQTPEYQRVSREWQALQADAQAWAGSPYPPVFVTVDMVVRCAEHILLIQRGRAPGEGLWALPGGFIDIHETAWQSALRELQEETGWSLHQQIQQPHAQAVFDHPQRSLRGRTITHAFFIDYAGPLPHVEGADDAVAAQWHPCNQWSQLREQLHDDHAHIVETFLPELAAPST